MARVELAGPRNVVGDKGYHSNKALTTLRDWEVRSYISEPERGRRRWKDNFEAQQAVYGNRRLIHLCDFTLSLIMRRCTGKGTPRSWQGHSADTCLNFLRIWVVLLAQKMGEQRASPVKLPAEISATKPVMSEEIRTCTTGC
jgi:hypothetical protein